jgi:BirA family biotin operon repressor/biotin-[acetyl-CoA-carboxylase] ligase
MAIVKSLESFGLKHVRIKWPNDIYVSGKKIAGILIETYPLKIEHNTGIDSGGGGTAVIIGIGLNYDMSPLGQDRLAEIINFTDICGQTDLQEIKNVPDRSELAASVLQHIVTVCQRFHSQAEQNLQEFRSGYDYCRQKQVDILLDDQTRFSGVAQGVTDRAELLVNIDGKERVFNSADVSVNPDAA